MRHPPLLPLLEILISISNAFERQFFVIRMLKETYPPCGLALQEDD